MPKIKGGDNIGRLLVMEFADNESSTFDEVLEVLKKHPDFQKYEMQHESYEYGYGICKS